LQIAKGHDTIMKNIQRYIPMDSEISIIRKWYKLLPFPARYDELFEAGLKTLSFPIADRFCNNTLDNFYIALHRCEAVADQCRKLGIPEPIFMETLSDLVTLSNTWYSFNLQLGLAEPGWIDNHLSVRLFQLGRLQFCMGTAPLAIPLAGILPGEPVLEVHIREGLPLTPEECSRSVDFARQFFPKYFPEHTFRCFVCDSWLLDPALHHFLPASSNILAFQSRFQIEKRYPSDSRLKYLFRWDARRHNLEQFPASSGFSNRIKTHVMAGGPLEDAIGWFL